MANGSRIFITLSEPEIKVAGTYKNGNPVLAFAGEVTENKVIISNPLLIEIEGRQFWISKEANEALKRAKVPHKDGRPPGSKTGFWLKLILKLLKQNGGRMSYDALFQEAMTQSESRLEEVYLRRDRRGEAFRMAFLNLVGTKEIKQLRDKLVVLTGIGESDLIEE